MKLGDAPKGFYWCNSTGSLGLDSVSTRYWWTLGRIIEIFWPRIFPGKQLSPCMFEAQNVEVCAYIDAEHAMDPDYAGKLGVKLLNF